MAEQIDVKLNNSNKYDIMITLLQSKYVFNNFDELISVYKKLILAIDDPYDKPSRII